MLSDLTRRQLLANAGMLGLGAGVDHAVASHGNRVGSGPRTGEPLPGRVPFFGEHQAGIATPAQDYLYFAAFDLTTRSAESLAELLKSWTAAAATLVNGLPLHQGAQVTDQVPADPGEALDLPASRLTLTFGFGPSLFADTGDPLGLADRRPTGLAPLPRFAGEELDPTRSDGDLCIQACAMNPQVAFHAIHALSNIAVGNNATLRWTQAGFGRTSSTSQHQTTPRNLMGFKDGTNNIRAEDVAEMDKHVWVGAQEQTKWMHGGTYLVARRINILFDVWDKTTLRGQERAIGRTKISGAPLNASHEYDPVDLDSVAIPDDAHVRLTNPANNSGHRILRRGYSFSEPSDATRRQIEAGLFFISFQRDPRFQFIPLQRRLSISDALNRHTVHTASAVFACPPGIRPDTFIGAGMLA